METGQNQFLFARINVDIADSKNAGDVGFEAGRVHNDLFSFERQAPIRNRTEFGLQAEENEQVFGRNTASDAVGAGDLNLGHLAVFFREACDLTDFKLHFPVVAELFHLAHRGRSSSEAFSAVNQNNAFGFADEVEAPVKGGVSAAANNDVLALKNLRILDAVVELFAFELFNVRNFERAGLEAADAGCNEDSLG